MALTGQAFNRTNVELKFTYQLRDLLKLTLLIVPMWN